MFALSPVELEALGLSLKVGLWAVVGSLPLGLFVAWVLARCRFPGHGVLNAVVHLPLVLPPVVVGYVLLLVLGRNGVLGAPLHEWLGWSFAFTWEGAAVASAVVAFPLLVRSIRLSLELVDRRLETAARTLGAGRLDVFWNITVPLVLPGIVTGAVLAFARSIGEFGATITFVSNIPGVTQTLPLALYTAVQTPGGDTIALRLVVISCILAFGALAASEILSRHVRRRIMGSGA